MAEQELSQDFKKWVGQSDMPAGKKKVVLAALELFSKKGFDGTSTQEIAKTSGMSQATIFKYFKTKEDLLEFIITPLMNNIFPVYVNDFQKELVAKKGNIEDLIHFVVQNRYHFLVDNREVALIVLSEILTKDKFRDKFVELVEKRGSDIIQVFVKMAHETGQIRADIKPETIIRMVVSQILFYFVQNNKVLTPKSAEETKQDLAEIEKVVISAIKK
ncbi:TetR/AcrR family transcriptional regulator [Companilactobacillus zhachilii]|uniref:TetR/AcrR family transcriptional regulator n=1 Tax=Companilactobacillus zhachilii TaxID=2304606 RepID=UPI001921C70E|nr:TetR/AcrR family transcriptional regulator [Companilactobacillus zhachilii]MBL3531513.1 TetR/AcrR family transcriptional regulator [Companilactobacillus zhachilii]